MFASVGSASSSKFPNGDEVWRWSLVRMSEKCVTPSCFRNLYPVRPLTYIVIRCYSSTSLPWYCFSGCVSRMLDSYCTVAVRIRADQAKSRCCLRKCRQVLQIAQGRSRKFDSETTIVGVASVMPPLNTYLLWNSAHRCTLLHKKKKWLVLNSCASRRAWSLPVPSCAAILESLEMLGKCSIQNATE